MSRRPINRPSEQALKLREQAAKVKREAEIELLTFGADSDCPDPHLESIFQELFNENTI